MENIYSRQIAFQERMNTNYDIQYLALVGELGELVDSFGFADWKVDVRDEENILVEGMDICIFAMNCNHYLKRDFIQPDVSRWANYSDYQLVDEIVEHMSNKKFLEIVQLIFTAYPEVKTRIIGKQALNTFRQDNGYKEGTYKKMWNGVQDNVYMFEITKSNETFDEIYEALSLGYKCLQ